jgi:hypothetical protein
MARTFSIGIKIIGTPYFSIILTVIIIILWIMTIIEPLAALPFSHFKHLDIIEVNRVKIDIIQQRKGKFRHRLGVRIHCHHSFFKENSFFPMGQIIIIGVLLQS